MSIEFRSSFVIQKTIYDPIITTALYKRNYMIKCNVGSMMLAIFIFILKTYYMTQMIKKKVSTKHCIKWHSIMGDSAIYTNDI